MNAAEDSSLAHWLVTGLIVIFVLYPLSLGPVTRLFNDDLLPEWVGWPYVFLLLALDHAPPPVQNAFEAYVEWWLR